jgi:raffinose/stachyose/melibiose transport system permease protein
MTAALSRRTAVQAASGSPRTSRAPRVRAHLEGYLYILPALAVFAVFVVWPLTQGVWLSFWNWDGLSPARWVGLSNYLDIVRDPDLRGAFVHSAFLVVFWTVVPIAVGLFLAVLLSHPRLKGTRFMRAVLFLPQIIPLVAVGIVWRWIFEPGGPLNSALRAAGAGALARGWLGDYTWSLTAVGTVATWIVAGFCMVLFLVGMQNIPTELYDAARVDGAGALAQFRHVTLPGLRHVLTVAVVVTVISAFRSFDLVFVMTQGGPGTSSSVPAWQVYRRAFFYDEIGSAAALGITLGVLILVIVMVLNRPAAGAEQ